MPTPGDKAAGHAGTDHQPRAERSEAIASYVRWRNANAQHKRDFAPTSTIRTWTGYVIKLLDAALDR